MFFLNLPTNEERKSIFEVHLKRYRPDSIDGFQTTLLSDLSKESNDDKGDSKDSDDKDEKEKEEKEEKDGVESKLKEMTVNELKTILREMELPVSGSKTKLISRIIENTD